MPTGIPGLDTVLRGGFLNAGIYIVRGEPGTGKTILGNQFCFNHAAAGHRAIYVTLLAETHDRMTQHMRTMCGRPRYSSQCWAPLITPMPRRWQRKALPDWEQVEARITQRTVELFHKGERVACHVRSGIRGRHTTLPEHMPSAHRRYAGWTIDRIRRDAAAIGPDTAELTAVLLESRSPRTPDIGELPFDHPNIRGAGYYQ